MDRSEVLATEDIERSVLARDLQYLYSRAKEGERPPKVGEMSDLLEASGIPEIDLGKW